MGDHSHQGVFLKAEVAQRADEERAVVFHHSRYFFHSFICHHGDRATDAPHFEPHPVAITRFNRHQWKHDNTHSHVQQQRQEVKLKPAAASGLKPEAEPD